MKVVRISDISGETNEMEIPALTPEQFKAGMARHAKGELIQRVFPQLGADEREFLMTGITPEEWAETFHGPEEEPDGYYPDPCDLEV